MKRKQIYLDDKADMDLKKWSLRKGVSEARLIREAVAHYLVNIEKEAREKAADDPLARLVGHCPEPGDPDAAVDHDAYLYRRDGE